MKPNVFRMGGLAIVLSLLALAFSFSATTANPPRTLAASENSWHSPAHGLGWPYNGENYAEIYALAVMGTDVYAGGYFTSICGNAACTAGNKPANRIAKWNGTGWSSLGNGFNDSVNALAVIGNTLYAGGEFSALCGNAACNSGNTLMYGIAKWNGGSWSAVGNGLYPEVNALAVQGNELYAGGFIYDICADANCDNASASANNIVKWNGSSWSAVGNGFDHTVYALTANASTVYAGGGFDLACGNADCNSNNTLVHGIAKWNGSTWSGLGWGFSYDVYALALNGSDLYAGGGFWYACEDKVCNDGAVMNSIAKWNGSAWSPLAYGVYPGVNALTVHGGNLYAGGEFHSICGNLDCNSGNTFVNSVARWNLSSGAWSGLAGGFGDSEYVYALATVGSDIFAAGTFTLICGNPNCDSNNTPVNRIARYGAAPTCAKPAKPTLKKPVSGAVVAAVRPKLKWNASTCATTYNIIIRDAATGQTVQKIKGHTKLQFKPTALTRNKTYKWFVQAVNSNGKTKSAKWTFTVQP